MDTPTFTMTTLVEHRGLSMFVKNGLVGRRRKGVGKEELGV